MSEPKRSERELELEDRLADLMAGFELWKQHKVASMEWSSQDEMFSRWVEYDQP